VLGRNRVAVPTHHYKVILAEGGQAPPGLGVFVVPNKPIKNASLTDFKVMSGEARVLRWLQVSLKSGEGEGLLSSLAKFVMGYACTGQVVLHELCSYYQ